MSSIMDNVFVQPILSVVLFMLSAGSFTWMCFSVVELIKNYSFKMLRWAIISLIASISIWLFCYFFLPHGYFIVIYLTWILSILHLCIHLVSESENLKSMLSNLVSILSIGIVFVLLPLGYYKGLELLFNFLDPNSTDPSAYIVIFMYTFWVPFLPFARILPDSNKDDYKSGYKQGKEDGYSQGHDDGYEEGYEDGRLDALDEPIQEQTVSEDDDAL